MSENKNGENMEINESFFAKDRKNRWSYDFEPEKQVQINMLVHELDLLAIDYMANKYGVSRNSILNDLIEVILKDIVLFDDEFVSENDARFLLTSKVDRMLGKGSLGSWSADLFYMSTPKDNFLRTFLPQQKAVWDPDTDQEYYEKITSNQYDILEKKLKQIKKKD